MIWLSFLNSIKQALLPEKTLYYPGCITKFALSDIENNYTEILKLLNINFIKLKDIEYCCGSPILNAGYKEEFREIIEKNTELLREHKITKIITNCPACYNAFNKHYNIKVEHITQTIINNIDKLILKDFEGKEIHYHDPCYLGRHSQIYDEPRNILKALNIEVQELSLNREKSQCCGAGGNVKANLPKTSNRIVESLIKREKITELITCCPMCFIQFKNTDIKVYELSQLII